MPAVRRLAYCPTTASVRLVGYGVAWTTILRAKNEESVRKLVRRLQEVLCVDLDLGDVERYWKDESQYRCFFRTPLPSLSEEGPTASVLALAGRVAYAWHVNGLAPGTPIEGVATERDGIRVSGVTFLSFSLLLPE